jgi:hypothetical protein
MFLLDDLLMAPVSGFFSIFRKLHEAVQQENANESEAIRQQLSELYMRLETGQLSEEEFDEQEKLLLDRLDELDRAASEETDELSDEMGEEDEVDDFEEDEEDEDFEEEEVDVPALEDDEPVVIGEAGNIP